MVETGLEINETRAETQLPNNLLFFKREAAKLDPLKSAFVGRLITEGCLERYATYLYERVRIKSHVDTKGLDDHLEKDRIDLAPRDIISKKFLDKTRGHFFEEVAYLGFDSQLPEGFWVLNPKASADVFRRMGGDRAFPTVVDGLVFSEKGDSARLAGVAEYKLRPTPAHKGNYLQAETLLDIRDRWSHSQIEGEIEVETRHRDTLRVDPKIDSLAIYYVVPRESGHNMRKKTEGMDIKVFETPLNAWDVRRLFGGLMVDYWHSKSAG